MKIDKYFFSLSFRGHRMWGRDQNCKRNVIFCLLFFTSSFLPAQTFYGMTLFPDTTYGQSFPADAHAHRMSVENIAFTKNIRASMGATIPVFGFALNDLNAQASFGASVHFDLHPIGQAQISSNDYFIDFFILDIEVGKHQFVRFVTGHTSHHLSDNWYERLQLTSSVRYSRDYIKLFYIYNNGLGDQFYCGADYAYIFTIGQKVKKPWRLQAGGEASLLDLYGIADLYAAMDIKLRQEAGFAATNTFQIGVKIPMRNFQLIRLAYQFRFGLDERGQFFPQHRTLSTLGVYFDL